MIVDEDDCYKAHVERAFTDCHDDTWDALADLYVSVTDDYPAPHFDLLGWFMINYHYHQGDWVYIKKLHNA